MRKSTKTVLVIGLALLVYGYLSRLLALYFFWDSKPFGWIALFVALLFYLVDLHRARRKQGKKTVWITIGIVFIILGFVVSTYVVIAFHKSEPYQIAINYLKTNPHLKKEVGNVKSFGLIPSGSMETTSFNGSESGRATFTVTIFGDKKFKDVDVNLRKTPETDWTVISVH